MKNTHFVKHLDKKLAAVLEEVKASAYWQEFISADRPDELRLTAMKWIMHGIWTYQEEVNRAVFTAVGRVGSQVEQQGLIRAMIAVQIEEIGHGTLALNDFLKLGGTPSQVQVPPSPSSLALIAVVRHLGAECHPLCHLGYMYFFERFTVMISDLVAPILINTNYPNDSLEFMRLHAQEDERHSHMLSEVITDALEYFAGAEQHIQYGFDCFRQVYPHPLWEYALRQAEEEFLLTSNS